MLGTRIDKFDAPRLLESEHGWWFIGNGTRTLLRPHQAAADGTIRPAVDDFLRREGAYRPRTPQSFVLTVLTTTACNLGCGYCFQNTATDPAGGFRPPRIGRLRLDSATIEQILRFAGERMRLAGLDKLHVQLFGGEPLLNPLACRELLERAQAFGMASAGMVSNGVLLRRKIAVDLYAAGLRSVQITFDGSQEDHDQIRAKRSGKATFDTITRNVAAATEATDLGWSFRINVSDRNYARIDELFGQLAGRVDPARCGVNFAWVGDAGFGYENGLTRAEDVCDSFVRWNIAALEAGFRISRPSMRVTCQTCSQPGARHGAVVNADGTLYSCWESAGKPGWEVGTVTSGYLPVADAPDRWVTCGYEYKLADQDVVTAFQDKVDSQILDYLHETKRL